MFSIPDCKFNLFLAVQPSGSLLSGPHIFCKCFSQFNRKVQPRLRDTLFIVGQDSLHASALTKFAIVNTYFSFHRIGQGTNQRQNLRTQQSSTTSMERFSTKAVLKNEVGVRHIAIPANRLCFCINENGTRHLIFLFQANPPEKEGLVIYKLLI